MDKRWIEDFQKNSLHLLSRKKRERREKEEKEERKEEEEGEREGEK